MDDKNLKPFVASIPGLSWANAASMIPALNARGTFQLKLEPKMANVTKETPKRKKRVAKRQLVPQRTVNLLTGGEVIMPMDSFVPNTTQLPIPLNRFCICAICAKRMSNSVELMYHWMDHRPAFYCTICTGVQFATEIELMLHFMRHGLTVQCCVCLTEFFQNPATYYHHLKNECGPPNWKNQCKFCLHTFPKGPHLDNHYCLEMQHAFNEKNQQLREPPQKKKREDSVLYANTNNSRFTYFIMPEIPLDFSVPKKTLPLLDRENFMCIMCGERKRSLKELLSHWIDHKFNRKLEQNFRCPACKTAKFKFEIELYLHFIRHEVPQECPYECLTPSFNNVENMLMHVKICQPKYWSFKCALCKRKCPNEGGHPTCTIQKAQLDAIKAKEDKKKNQAQLTQKRLNNAQPSPAHKSVSVRQKGMAVKIESILNNSNAQSPMGYLQPAMQYNQAAGHSQPVQYNFFHGTGPFL